MREECQIAEEAARAQGLPRLPPEKSASLRNMLCAFHAIEAATFYPQVQDAEVNLHWLWEDAPGGPLLLEGKVDVVITGGDTSHPELYLWDYKTTRQPEPGAEMTSYQWQMMRLYAFLYRRHFGVTPQGMVLYFMGELANQRARAGRPARAIFHMPASRQSDEQTLAWLSRALEIEERCRTSGQWDPPAPEDAPRRMCKNCSIRLSCPAISVPFPWEAGAGQDDDFEPYDQ